MRYPQGKIQPKSSRVRYRLAISFPLISQKQFFSLSWWKEERERKTGEEREKIGSFRAITPRLAQGKNCVKLYKIIFCFFLCLCERTFTLVLLGLKLAKDMKLKLLLAKP